MAFLRRTRESFGLDIGSSAVKVVQIRNGDGHRLAALGVVPLGPDSITEGAIRNPTAIASAIREAVSMAGVRSRDAVIGVSGRELIIKKVQIPEVPARELHDAVQLEAEHHIPFAIDEVFLDYHVVGTREGVMDLILVAVKKSKVTEYTAVVEDAGFAPVVVDVDGFALGNQFELNHPESRGEAVALIDIGASTMKTNVVRGGASIFARDIPFGGNNYTQAIAQHLHVPLEQAEAAKVGRDVGIAWDAIVPALEAVSRELSLEIQRTFDYFASTADSERIGKIVLAGGCSQLPGLADYLSSTWGIAVDVARPFERVDVGDFAETVAAAGPSLAVAVGLGLRHAGDREP
ncbi:MAG: type IV pilus assembly protein PilM [Candidatus Rokuibacteriota bacterium]